MEIKADNIYTVKETAEYFKCGMNTIYKLIKIGKLEGLKIGRLKITGSSILALRGKEN